MENELKDPLLDQSIAEIPNSDKLYEFYFQELIYWFDHWKDLQDFNKNDNDFFIRYTLFPPSPIPEIGETQEEIKLRHIGIERLRRRSNSGLPGRYPTEVFLSSMLNQIQKNITAFLVCYAKARSIEKIFNEKNIQSEIALIDLLSKEISEVAKSNTKQLLPTMFHLQNHGYLMSARDKIKFELEPDVENKFTYEFHFSYKCSKNFLKVFSELLAERKKLIEKLVISPEPSASEDEKDEMDFNKYNDSSNKIKFNLSVHEIGSLFLELAKNNIIEIPVNSNNKINISDLSRKITEHFESSNQKTMSLNSVKNKIFLNKGLSEENLEKFHQVVRNLSYIAVRQNKK